MSLLLTATRDAFGPAPRALGTWAPPPPPKWMPADDALHATYPAYRRLLETGDIVWAHVIQANSALYGVGAQDAPATVAFGADRAVDLGPARLGDAASRAFRLKGTKPKDVALARIAEMLTDSMGRKAAYDLPIGLTRGAAVRAADVMIHRAFLPQSRLLTRELPVVVSPARDAVALLPRRFWADDLQRQWPMLSVRLG